MKNNSIFLALLGVSALLFVGCMKEEAINEQYRPAGSEILIGASTDYDNGEATRTEYDSVEPATRTDYSGAIYGSSPKRERVDWLAGDNMTIFYRQGTAAATSGVYGVTTINPDNEKSYADVTNTGGTKLTWGDGTGDHYFYAMYPAKGFGGNNGMDLTNTNHVNGTIPATQDIDVNHKITVDGQLKYQPDMKYAYLVSYKKIDAGSTATRAELPFRPAVTTFEYKFKLNDNDAATERTVTKFTMEASTNLTGTFEFDITGGNDYGATWGTVSQGTNNGKIITVNFPEGTKLTKTAYLDFSVLALPVQQKDVKITFYFKESDGTEYHKYVTIKKNGSNATFAAAKKHIITNDALTGELITYTFEGEGGFTTNYLGGSSTYQVTSYKQVGTSGQKIAIPWEAYQYRVKIGSEGYSGWTSEKPVWLPTFTTSGTGSTSAKSFDVKIAPSDRHSTAIDALTNAGTKGSATNPYDLSTHNITGGNISKTTANCYVVSAPGWYKFPLVYGNGYKNGSANTNAYAPNKLTAGRYLTPFIKHSGMISSPDIASVSKAELLWQDSQDLITVDDIKIDNGYVVFHVEKDNICEGNAVIAAKSSEGTVLWSWHIWVTPYTGNVTMRGQTLQARNLGWCDGGEITWPERRVQVRFRQPGGKDEVITLTFIQSGNELTLLGTGPHYQWGRKDPIIPPFGKMGAPQDETANKIWYNAAGVASQDVPLAQGPKNIQYSIEHPMDMIWVDRYALPAYKGGSPYSPYTDAQGGWPFSDWIGSTATYYGTGHYVNLWNYNATVNDKVDNMLTVKTFNSLAHGKTVYDPCPIGYTVPLPTELAKLAITTEQMGGTDYRGSGTISWSASDYGWKSNGNVLPANGMRFYLANNQHVGNVGTNGYYFSSAYCNMHNGLSLIMDKNSIHMTASFAKGSGRSIRCVPE